MMRHTMSALVASALVGLALAAPAFAQAPPPGQSQPFPEFGGPGHLPFALGTIQSVDATAGTITLTPQNGGAGQIIKVGANAQIVTLATVSVADMKVGDRVAVQGMPTGITASQMTVGQPPAGLPGAGGFGFLPRAAGAGGAGSTDQGFAMATGQIKTLPTKTDPHLSIMMGPDVQIFLKIAEGARLTKYVPVALSGLKSGDQLFARGEAGGDGTLTASVVGVNMAPGGSGRGRFGGRPGSPPSGLVPGDPAGGL